MNVRMEKNLIRIILVEDHEMVRASLKQLFKDIRHIEVVADCSNGLDAIELASELKPHVVLVDVNMTPIDGFETSRRLLNSEPAVRVIGLSMNTHPHYAQRMLDNGARGYVTKSSPFAEILRAIEEVHEGSVYICEEVRKKM